MRKPLAESRDAFGRALLDHLAGEGGCELVERDDGYIDLSAGADVYFAPPTGMQCDIAGRAHGRVLDVGCGAGRYALWLQERGHDVVGIDASPLAIDVCRRRGLKQAHALTLEQVTPALGRFDTILMMGHNFGLFGGFHRARRLLKRLHAVMNEGGRIVAETMDPYQSRNPDHLAYHARNRERGRLPGQIRMRVRYRMLSTPWFDYLFVSRAEMDGILDGTGWHIAEMLSDEGPSYAVVLEETARPHVGRTAESGTAGTIRP